uniref:Uncharacterized protein n=1 Tax=Romanomermis culicivorax TaxID=13658 RepID=A0A915ILG5_ROMCU
MPQATILVLMALCSGTLVVKSSGDEAYDEEKSKEAIRLWIGQQLLDQVRSGDPAFVVGLEYNCSVNRVQIIW